MKSGFIWDTGRNRAQIKKYSPQLVLICSIFGNELSSATVLKQCSRPRTNSKPLERWVFV